MEDTPPIDSAIIGSDAGSDAPPAAVTRNNPIWRPPRSRVDRAAEDTALACIRRKQPAEALKILMTAYGDPVTAFALRIVRDHELAKDVTQQAFLEAFQNFDKFGGLSSLWSWLCSIARHRSLDELRRRRASGGDDLEVLDDLVGQLDPMMDADRVAKRRALEQCLGELSPAKRARLLMRCFLGLTYVEIGETVGSTHSTIQVSICRMLLRLRKCLRGEGLTR